MRKKARVILHNFPHSPSLLLCTTKNTCRTSVFHINIHFGLFCFGEENKNTSGSLHVCRWTPSGKVKSYGHMLIAINISHKFLWEHAFSAKMGPMMTPHEMWRNEDTSLNIVACKLLFSPSISQENYSFPPRGMINGSIIASASGQIMTKNLNEMRVK